MRMLAITGKKWRDYNVGKPAEVIDQHLSVGVLHTEESAAKLARSLSTEQLREWVALSQRQDKVLAGVPELLHGVARAVLRGRRLQRAGPASTLILKLPPDLQASDGQPAT